jgi:diguanylate cyclase (GGDEF)-like protein/PAS domain S-box-containing protein
LIASNFAHSTESVVLQLKWKHQFQFAGFYAAQSQGFFAEEGLDVEIREVDKTRSSTEVVLSGDAQYGIADSSLVLSRMRGLPVVALAAIFQHSPMVLLTKQSSDIINPLELKGKRVMYQKNIDDAVLLAMFSEVGLDLNEITHIPQSFDYKSLVNDEVDAFSVYTTNQPFFFKQLGIPVNILSPANYGIDFYGDMLFVEENYLKDNKEQVLAFRRASLKGWEYALKNPKEIIDWILTHTNTEITREHLLFEAERTARVIQPELIELGYFNPNRLLRIASIYKKQQLVSNNAHLDGINYQDYFKQTPTLKSWLPIMGLTLIVLFSLALTLWLINARLKKQVAKRTHDLNIANNALNDHLRLINRFVITSSINNDGFIIDVSDAFCEITGYSKAECIGKHLSFLLHPDTDSKEITQGKLKLMRDQCWFGELVFNNKQGEDVWLKCETAAVIDESGNMTTGYASVYIDITDKKNIETLSFTDALTGLANRRLLDNELEKTFALALRHNRPMSILLLDLDNFKKINDTYGHLIGDDVIKHVSKTLLTNSRKSDTTGRWGGEEFLIICPETTIDGAVTFAELLRNKIYRSKLSGLPRQTCSFGVAQWQNGESIDDLLERADRGLYQAKEKGRNCVVSSDIKQDKLTG